MDLSTGDVPFRPLLPFLIKLCVNVQVYASEESVNEVEGVIRMRKRSVMKENRRMVRKYKKVHGLLSKGPEYAAVKLRHGYGLRFFFFMVNT